MYVYIFMHAFIHWYKHFHFTTKDPGNDVLLLIPEERICMTNTNGSFNGMMNQTGKCTRKKNGTMPKSTNPDAMQRHIKPMKCDCVNLDDSKLVTLMQRNLEFAF